MSDPDLFSYFDKIQIEAFETIITVRKQSLQRLCFYTCQSFCSQGGGGDNPPPPGRYPPGQVHPPGQAPPRQVHPTPGQAPPRPGTPPGQTHPSPVMVNQRAVRILLECILVHRFLAPMFNCFQQC